MKKITILFALFVVFALNALAQVAINTDNTPPDASAMLDVKSTNNGFLPPRVAHVSDISNPTAGLMVYDQEYKCLRNYDGSNWSLCMGEDNSGKVSSKTGKIWLDRNLGATEVATSKTDANAYGDLYQWGRAADGHEKRNSGIYGDGTELASTAASSSGNAWDGKFIKSTSSPYDWLSTQDNTLWQGVTGTNNPCPTGFRLPTETEWHTERASWSSNDADGAFGSPLKLVVGGWRYPNNGLLYHVGSRGHYWSSTVNGTRVQYLYFSNDASTASGNRAGGFSVRCIKD